MITPLLRKGDYIYGSFVKPEHINGYINNTNPGDLSDHLGRVPFSLSNTNEAIAYTKIITLAIQLSYPLCGTVLPRALVRWLAILGMPVPWIEQPLSPVES